MARKIASGGLVDENFHISAGRFRICQIYRVAAAYSTWPGDGLKPIMLRAILFNIYLYVLTAGLAVSATPCLLLPRIATVRMMRFWARRVRWGLEAIAQIRIEFRGRHYLTPE